MRVVELAREAGVTPATVRYYARVELLSPTRNLDNNYRCFSGADRQRVRFVRQAQTLGLTIGDIKAVLKLADRGEDVCNLVRTIVEQRLRDVHQRLVDLQQTEARAAEALASWTSMPSLVPHSGERYPLIERHGAHQHRYNRPVKAEGAGLHELLPI